MTDMNDIDLVMEFVAESRENLAQIEPDLLVLEREGSQTDQELVNRIFRAIHTIKGASGFFGFDALGKLSHVMENLLMSIRDKKLTPTPTIIEPLLAGVDILRAMLDDIYASEQIPCDAIIQQMQDILEGGSPPAPVEAPSTQQPPEGPPPLPKKEESPASQTLAIVQSDKTAVETAVAHGKKLYFIQVNLDEDVLDKGRELPGFIEQLSGVGTILDVFYNLETLPDLKTCLETDTPLLFFYASILEEDLLELAVDVPKDRIALQSGAEILGSPGAKEEPHSPQTDQPQPFYPEEREKDAAPATDAIKQTAAKLTGPHASAALETVRVRVDILNRLMELAGEMVLARNQLMRTVERLGKQEALASGLPPIVQNIDLITVNLQEHIMQTRLQPIGSVFEKFPRVVRDMARHLGKEIDLQMSGGHAELDKSIIENLSAPLTHIIRNCCDHAIESPEERIAAGKPRIGTICLQVYQEGGQIFIAITDDGRGIDYDRIASKALENSLITQDELERMSVQDKINLIFLPGLSTARSVSDISGRGVGMDVVKTNIEKLGGLITIETIQGEGTTIMLCLPLTMAIIPSLIVEVMGQRFAMPQINLAELVCVKAAEVSRFIGRVGSADVLRLRDELIPIVHLADVLNIQKYYRDRNTQELRLDRRTHIADIREHSQEQSTGREKEAEKPQNRRKYWKSNYNILVLKVSGHTFGVIVDELHDTEEIVVKPLPGYLQDCKCYAGATIMGDGSVALILDAAGLLSVSNLTFSAVNAQNGKERTTEEQNQQEPARPKHQYLLFDYADGETFALPLNNVIRLDRFPIGNVEQIGDREFLPYQGQGLPLVRLSRYFDIRPFPETRQDAYLIVSKTPANMQAGIIASRIRDIVETDIEPEPSVLSQAGLSGSAVLNNHMTMFIQPEVLMHLANLGGKGES